MTPLSTQKFNEKMREKGFSDTSKREGKETVKVWEGCTLRSDLRGDNDTVV